MMKRKTETLDAAFKKRFFALSSEQAPDPAGFSSRDNSKRLTLKKGTIRAIEHRRDSMFGTLDNRKVSLLASSNLPKCSRTTRSTPLVLQCEVLLSAVSSDSSLLSRIRAVPTTETVANRAPAPGSSRRRVPMMSSCVDSNLFIIYFLTPFQEFEFSKTSMNHLFYLRLPLCYNSLCVSVSLVFLAAECLSQLQTNIYP